MTSAVWFVAWLSDRIGRDRRLAFEKDVTWPHSVPTSLVVSGSNRYSNASPSKTIKPSAQKEASVLVSTHQTFNNIETLCMEGGMCVSAHTSNWYSNALPLKTLKGRRHVCLCTRIKPICQCFTFKNIKILSIEESMGVSAHDSYGYSNASPSKTLKPSMEEGMGVSAHHRWFLRNWKRNWSSWLGFCCLKKVIALAPKLRVSSWLNGIFSEQN